MASAAKVSFGQRRLAPVVAHFVLAHPGLRVSLMLEDHETDIVSSGMDLAVRISYPSDSSLVARPIASVPRYVCASPEYLARRGTPKYKDTDSIGMIFIDGTHFLDHAPPTLQRLPPQDTLA
jgi:DNA-binding transcriptional LysR family regulator